MAVATGLRLCVCFFFGFAIICAARNTILFSGEEVAVEAAPAAEGRSLVENLNDYSEASANHGHDPRNKVVGGGGRRSRDFP